MTSEISPEETRPDPKNPSKTIPRTWGVWDTGPKASGQRYCMGNFPIRESELKRDKGAAKLIALYTRRESAVAYAKELNN